MINNYLGVPGQSGEELLESFMDHVLKMDIEVLNTKAEAINELKGKYQVLAGDQVITSWTVVVATGLPYRQTLPREDFFLGKGLGYCATCDGPIYKDKDVLIIGHSPEAEAEANFMNEICRGLYIALYKTQPRWKGNNYSGFLHDASSAGFCKGLRCRTAAPLTLKVCSFRGRNPRPLIQDLELADNHIRGNRNQEPICPVLCGRRLSGRRIKLQNRWRRPVETKCSRMQVKKRLHPKRVYFQPSCNGVGSISFFMGGNISDVLFRSCHLYKIHIV
jgi:thioredoxin reductase (NADPH)